MKKLLTLVVLLMTTISFGQQNLVTNGDFETWTDPTTLTSFTITPFTAGVSQETTIKHAGTYAAKHTTPLVTVPASTTSVKIQNETVTVIPGHSYTISYWFLDNDVNAKSRPWIYWIDGTSPTPLTITDATSDVAFRPSTYSTDNTQWQQFTQTFTAPALSAKLRFEVRSYNTGSVGGGFIYYDDFSVIDNSSMATNQNNKMGLIVYPNPVNNGLLNIQTTNNSVKNVVVYDLLGKQVLSTSTSNSVNVSSLNSGIYTMKIKEEDNTGVMRIVIN